MFFFFFKQKTAYEMRISDWSSDVCSSDLALLTAAIIGDPTKIYDGNAVATLTSANYSLTGFIAGEGASVTQTVGAYDSAHAGDRTVTASLSAGDFAADSGTLLSNYVLPTEAAGMGTIDSAQLVVGRTGYPTKPYDGNDLAIPQHPHTPIQGLAPGE